MKILTNKPKSQTKLTMVVDGSNLAYRAYYKFGNIRSLTEGRLGVVYGFLKILQSYLIRFKPTQLVVIFDTKQSKNSNFRLAILPTYKASRSIKKNIKFDYEDFNRQMGILMKILKAAGVDVIIDKKGLGYECDDYLAEVISQVKGKSLIISADKDFVQLISKNTKIFNPSKDELIRLENVVNITGYTPSEHLDYLILTGDDSDNIPGYKGIGPVKAKQFLEKHHSIKEYLKDGQDEFKWVTLEGLKFLYERNRELIDLKFILKKRPIHSMPLRNHKYDHKKLKELLTKYGMATLLTQLFFEPLKNLTRWTQQNQDKTKTW